MLMLGRTYNSLHDDAQAIRWFDLARRSPDSLVAGDAGRAWHNLHPDFARFRTSGWIYPLYSSRWRDLFSYAQFKTEMRVPGPVQPYVSARFIGDSRGIVGEGSPEYLSESATILGLGVATRTWRRSRAWFEAGSAVGYLSGHMLPDYRGGVSWTRSFVRRDWFFESGADGVFVSRFGNDFLIYSQNRWGRSLKTGGFRWQVYWNGNYTTDVQRQYWANFAETGPGLRVRWNPLPEPLYFTVNFLRGAYTRNEDNPRRPNFFDLRVGFWYAFSR